MEYFQLYYVYVATAISLELLIIWLFFNSNKVAFNNDLIEILVEEFEKRNDDDGNASDSIISFWALTIVITLWPYSMVVLFAGILSSEIYHNDKSKIIKFIKPLAINIITKTIIKIIWFPFHIIFNMIFRSARDNKLLKDI